MASAATDVGLREATLRGLQREPKQLPTVWLYDELGSQLYEEVTRLPEYYPPRREREILRARSSSSARETRNGRACCSTHSRRRSSASSRST